MGAILTRRTRLVYCLALLFLLAILNPSVAHAAEKTKYFATERFNMLIALMFVCSAIIYYVNRATRGEKLFLRRIAGVSAVEEAVGRATEMGRSILFIPGIMDMDEVQTLASINILGHVAYKAAEYETLIKVPTCRSFVMSTAQEVVKEAYLRAGRPDSYNSENVFYLTDDQFGYAAGVDGIMLREKPATVFMLGCFYAESLILAETGNHIGAIQIAGTAMPSQIPFFVAACDYTLIGEELFAASAYLANEPKLLGSLRGQDVGKLLFMFFVIFGFLLEILVRYQVIPESLSLVSWLATQQGKGEVFMKREIPVLITLFVGIIVLIEFFIPPLKGVKDNIVNWTNLIIVFAVFLGIISLIQVHGQRISRKSEGWSYSAALLFFLFFTACTGLFFGLDKNISDMDVFVGNSGLITLRDTETGKLIKEYEGHTSDVLSVSTHDKEMISGDAKGTIIIWDREKAEMLWKSQEKYKDKKGRLAFKKILDVGFSPDGKYFAVAGEKGLVKVWNSKDRKMLFELGKPEKKEEKKPEKKEEKKPEKKEEKKPEKKKWKWVEPSKHTATVTGLAFSPDSKQLVTGDVKGNILLWDLATGKKVRYFDGFVGPVNSVKFMPDGKKILSVDEDGILVEWDVATGKELRSLEGLTGALAALSVSKDGKKVMLGSSDKGVYIWDTKQVKKLSELNMFEEKEEKDKDGKVKKETIAVKAHKSSVKTVALGGNIAISGAKLIRIWDLKNNKLKAEVKDLTNDVTKVKVIDDKSFLACTKVPKFRNPFYFMYKYFYTPLQSTMFSLLAFFMASAAYRAFRAKTKEATFLLIAAFLVMLGRVPIGEIIPIEKVIGVGTGDIANWIMQVPNMAGQRAILIGAALGIVSAGLRVLLGLEQEYLGRDQKGSVIMKKLLNILENIDRRIIYGAMFFCVGLPLIFPLGLPIKISPPVQSLYDYIESLKPGDKVAVSFDYDPASYPEVHPMAVAILKHCFRKDLKVVSPALWPVGASMANDAFAAAVKDYPKKKYGIDYINLGYCAGPTVGHPQVMSFCIDIKKARPTDERGTPLDVYAEAGKIMEGVTSLKDVKIVVSLSAGDPGIPAWVEIAKSRFSVNIAAGSTAVQAPQFYPYIQSKQLTGFLGGLRGAAEYETAIKKKGMATAGMDSQSFAHLWIIILIVLANIMFIIEKKEQKRKGQEFNMTVFGIWIGAFLTLCIFSFLFKDNPFYKFAEHVFVGVSAGYWIARYIHSILIAKLFSPLFGGEDFFLILPLFLGLMMLLKIHPNLKWASRWPIAFVVGCTVGLVIIGKLQANVVEQCVATVKPFQGNPSNVYVAVQKYADKYEDKKPLEKKDFQNFYKDFILSSFPKDRNGDGLISKEELKKFDGVLSTTFAKMDKNRDGILTTVELDKFAKRYPKKYPKNFDRKKWDFNGDGVFSLKECIVYEGMPLSIIKILDAGKDKDKAKEGEKVKDGSLDKSELNSFDLIKNKFPIIVMKEEDGKKEYVMESFKNLDSNKDDKLTMLEWHAPPFWNMTVINGILSAIGVICGLIYFFFSKEHKGVFGASARVGIFFLMVCFGASFGYTVMARISLLIGRMYFLLKDFLGTMGIPLISQI